MKHEKSCLVVSGTTTKARVLGGWPVGFLRALRTSFWLWIHTREENKNHGKF